MGQYGRPSQQQLGFLFLLSSKKTLQQKVPQFSSAVHVNTGDSNTGAVIHLNHQQENPAVAEKPARRLTFGARSLKGIESDTIR